MKTIQKIFQLLGIVLLLAACEGNNYDLEKMIKDKKNPVKYVIEGQISNVVRKQHVFISRPGIINGSEGYESVHGAIVSLTDGEHTWVFRELPADSPKYDELYAPNSPQLLKGGVYESEVYFAGKAGRTYTLSVNIHGETFSAQETMPIAMPMTPLEYSMLQQATDFTSYIYGAPNNAIWTSEKSNTPGNFMNKENLMVLIKGRINFFERYYADDTQGNVNDLLILQDDMNTIRRYTTTAAYTDYIWAYTFGQGSSALAVEQNKHPSNFNDKKISGYFSAINCSQYRASMSAYEPQFISYLPSNKSYRATYAEGGQFVLKMTADGGCVLEGMGETFKGAYDIINSHQLRVYFISAGYGNGAKDLHHFYEATLKQATIFDLPDGSMVYRSGENALFEIQPDGSLKAQDGSLWQ